MRARVRVHTYTHTHTYIYKAAEIHNYIVNSCKKSKLKADVCILTVRYDIADNLNILMIYGGRVTLWISARIMEPMSLVQILTKVVYFSLRAYVLEISMITFLPADMGKWRTQDIVSRYIDITSICRYYIYKWYRLFG